MHVRRRFGALVSGLVGAAAPVVAAAAEEGGRALPAPESAGTAMLATVGAVAVLFLVWALGYLYEQHRGIRWDFQAPAAPTEEHH